MCRGGLFADPASLEPGAVGGTRVGIVGSAAGGARLQLNTPKHRQSAPKRHPLARSHGIPAFARTLANICSPLSYANSSVFGRKIYFSVP
jgi:hypothetical protein